MTGASLLRGCRELLGASREVYAGTVGAEVVDDLAARLDAGDRQGALDLVASDRSAAEEAAGRAQLAISGGRDLDMVPWTFVVSTEQWAYDGLDLATLQERLTARSPALDPFDQALAEVC